MEVELKIKINKKIKKNIENLDLNDKDLNKKIINYCEKYNFDINYIKEKIKKDIYFAVFFIKDPIKQNICEKLQFKYLKKMYPEIKKLPTNGKNARYFTLYNVSNDKNLAESKSLDFMLGNIYFCAKYIKENGGSQDNQYNDVCNFVKIFNNKDFDNNIYFKLILSGKYFTEKKIENLLSLLSDERLKYFEIIYW